MRSLFLELLDEEANIPKRAKSAFRSEVELGAMLRARATLMKKMDAAKAKGQLTQEQYDQLVTLNPTFAVAAGFRAKAGGSLRPTLRCQ